MFIAQKASAPVKIVRKKMFSILSLLLQKMSLKDKAEFNLGV